MAAAVNDGEDFQSFIQPGPFTPERATSPKSPARGFHDVGRASTLSFNAPFPNRLTRENLAKFSSSSPQLISSPMRNAELPHPREPDPSYSTTADSSAKGSHSPDLEIEFPRSSTDGTAIALNAPLTGGKAKNVSGPLAADPSNSCSTEHPRPSIFPFDNYTGLSFPPLQSPLRHQTGSSSSSEISC